MTTTHTALRPSHEHSAGRSSVAESKLIGVLGQFDDPDSLVEAAVNAREAGYQRLDAFSPFPVHGIDAALGIRRSRLPFFVLAIGIGGCFLGLFMQWYANAAEESPLFPGYAFLVSGKPFWSLPANIPVTFEVIVLSSAFATFFGMLALNRLPRLANPLQRIPRFQRATNDRFFLLIDHSDPQFDPERAARDLSEWGSTGVEEVREDLTDHRFPQWIKAAGVILALLLLLPPVMIYKAHFATNTQPRLHFNPDMDWQYRFRPQTVGPTWEVDRQPQYFFADHRVMREPVAGTIGRGKLRHDIEYFQGIKAGSVTTQQAPADAAPTEVNADGAGGPRAETPLLQEPTQSPSPDAAPEAAASQDAAEPQDPNHDQDPAQDAAANQAAAAQAAQTPAVPEPDWVTEFPAAVTVDEVLMQRGRERYQIYCTACHGYGGEGNGLVNQRAMELAVSNVIEKGTATNATWTQVKSLHDPAVTVQPVGRIFDTITNGRGTMGPYGRHIPTADRWAIVLYVKALQATRANEPKPPTPPPAGETPPANNPPSATNPASGDANDANPPNDVSQNQ